MEISYENTEEQYIELELEKIRTSSKHITKDILLRIIVICIFGALSYTKYKIDMNLYGYLTEAASPVILVYIVCGILWFILLPVLYWKLKSIVVVKEIENKKYDFQGNITYKLDDNCLLVESFDGKCKLDWDKVKGIKINKKIIKIKVSGDMDLVIPSSAFHKEESIDEFTKYISEKIGQNLNDEKEQEV